MIWGAGVRASNRWLSPLWPTFQQIAHARELLVRESVLVHELGKQLDRRATIDLVQHPSERRRAGLLGIDHGKIDVGLALAASVGNVPLQLERPDHARDARVSELGVYSVSNLGGCCFAQLPEHAHDVQLALG